MGIQKNKRIGRPAPTTKFKYPKNSYRVHINGGSNETIVGAYSQDTGGEPREDYALSIPSFYDGSNYKFSDLTYFCESVKIVEQSYAWSTAGEKDGNFKVYQQLSFDPDIHSINKDFTITEGDGNCYSQNDNVITGTGRVVRDSAWNQNRSITFRLNINFPTSRNTCRFLVDASVIVIVHDFPEEDGAINIGDNLTGMTVEKLF